ncbi:MAG TPA: S41 family peptidase [Tepidisphaeraceae bacterium]|jgi:carboxyl-terminal processing protease
MNREKFAWLFCGAVLSYLALQVPGSLAQRDSDYRFVRTLVDIYRQVSTNYVEGVDEPKLQQAAIAGMLNQLDPHTIYIPPDKQDQFNDELDGSFKGVGIRLDMTPGGEIEVITPIDDSPAWRAGVLPGDVILKVNGETITGMRKEDVVPKVQGPAGSSVTLTMRRATGEQVDLTMTREEFTVPMIKGIDRNPDNTWNFWADKERKIAYLRLTQFTPDVGEKINTILTGLLAEGMKGLVFDLRFNPGGRLEEAEGIIDLFVKEGTIVTVKGRNRPEQKKLARVEGTLPDFPIAVLVNEYSASASEVVAGALKDTGRGSVVGARTYGKGSVQEVVPLDGDAGEIKLTVAYWYLPSGKLVQRLKDAKEWGVEPDVVVDLDEAAQGKLVREQAARETMRVTTTVSTTKPATQPSATGPATTQVTEVVTDTQLEKAIELLREKVR